MLLANGCHRYQGYLFGRPLSADAFEELVRATEADDGVTA
jgi:EAL domain-containing protein (putative c-di-GMP-specific phosphodiesterase class I)